MKKHGKINFNLFVINFLCAATNRSTTLVVAQCGTPENYSA